MEAMLQSPNVETLWEDIVDCDTIMAAQAFRKYGYSSNPHVSKLRVCKCDNDGLHGLNAISLI
jgi:hypothetical protein